MWGLWVFAAVSAILGLVIGMTVTKRWGPRAMVPVLIGDVLLAGAVWLRMGQADRGCAAGNEGLCLDPFGWAVLLWLGVLPLGVGTVLGLVAGLLWRARRSA